jgi:hypothetical protein
MVNAEGYEVLGCHGVSINALVREMEFCHVPATGLFKCRRRELRVRGWTEVVATQGLDLRNPLKPKLLAFIHIYLGDP